MNKKVISCLAVSFGLLGLVSCNNQNGVKTASSSETPTPSASSTISVNNEVSMKNGNCYIDGLNKKLDLANYLEFKGNVTIDDLDFVSMDLEDGNNIVSLSGHEVTSIGYGDTTLLPQLKKSAPTVSDFSVQTFYIRVLNVKDIVGSFTSNNKGTSAMSFEIKEDKTFVFTRTAGTIPGSTDDVTVSEATIEGTYKIGDDGIFLFTPKTTDYCEFKATIYYDKKDGSEFHLNVFSPLNGKDIDLLGINFNISK